MSILLIWGREDFPAPENQTNGEAKPFEQSSLRFEK
jgi:hypothetical protein